ncbi:hypothetical protein CWI38_1012p0010 [Hamiltosporidium tvaerminnensis]|uniref:Uncharacterized protein n=1 Tax=Hamiltosporidium tvaerminnensis TaxID=1176355 RepID=A0A4Q9LW55_9MICR|nr:hypothetical protein CWI38_1012p0010 [Hamiltosporidium tvaerminnensis]
MTQRNLESMAYYSELGLVNKYSVEIIPYVISRNSIVTKYRLDSVDNIQEDSQNNLFGLGRCFRGKRNTDDLIREMHNHPTSSLKQLKDEKDSVKQVK